MRFNEVALGNIVVVNATASMVDLAGLEENVEYTIRVRAATTEGNRPCT